MHCYTQCPLHQAIANPGLCQRLLDTHGQVWVSLLWGHYSLLLVHTTFYLCPPRICFPVLCKFWHLYDGLMATSSKKVYAIPRSTAPRAPVPAAVHMLTHTSSVQFSRSVLSDSATPWIAEHQASLSIINSQSLLKLMSIESVMPSNHFILCCLLLLLSSIFPSIRVFSSESTFCMRWPKYWSFSFSICPSNEHLGLISFRLDWLEVLEVQGTRKSLLQHHSSKASILWHSGFFTVQLSHPYVTTGKTIV